MTLSVFSVVSAQQAAYASQRLARLGGEMSCKNIPANDTVFFCAQIAKSKPIVVNHNDRGQIIHLGISLFNNSTKELNRPVCNFIERLFLELTLMKTSEEQTEKLEEYGVKVDKAGFRAESSPLIIQQIIEEISQTADFSLYKDSACFVARWKHGVNQSLAITIPAVRELIFATDKKEADGEIGLLFASKACEQKKGRIEPPLFTNLDLTKKPGSDVYVHKGTVFMINEINSDTYFQRHDNQYRYIYNEQYPHESLINMFLSEQCYSTLCLHITHRMYGGVLPEFTLSLNEFVSLFKDDFNFYCGMQKSQTDAVKITVLLHSKDYNFAHMLLIETAKGDIFAKNGIVKANLYTNIPQHNIKSLFNP
ncbi:hypothetical protein D0T49_06865 [Paludibacter sp. 221]|nr:hypothetical protein [Paludibacter sp. 221]